MARRRWGGKVEFCVEGRQPKSALGRLELFPEKSDGRVIPRHPVSAAEYPCLPLREARRRLGLNEAGHK